MNKIEKDIIELSDEDLMNVTGGVKDPAQGEPKEDINSNTQGK